MVPIKPILFPLAFSTSTGRLSNQWAFGVIREGQELSRVQIDSPTGMSCGDSYRLPTDQRGSHRGGEVAAFSGTCGREFVLEICLVWSNLTSSPLQPNLAQPTVTIPKKTFRISNVLGIRGLHVCTHNTAIESSQIMSLLNMTWTKA